MIEAAPPRGRLATALAIVYIVWGSSFVATKVMVTDEPPLVAAGFRFTLAGLLLTAFSRWRYGRPNLGSTELQHILVMAFLAVLFSNASTCAGVFGVADTDWISATTPATCGVAIEVPEKDW